MADERFFVTGALGCLGAWVVRNLISENLHVTVYDLGSSMASARTADGAGGDRTD